MSQSSAAKPRSGRREEGVALLITVLLLLLVAALVADSIGHSGSESVSSARARNAARALHATNGGMQVAVARLSQSPPNMAVVQKL